MVRNGYVRMGSVRGAELSVHVSVFAVAVLLGLVGGSPFGLLGYVVVVLVHEFGHAGFAWAFGLRVRRVAVHFFGGACEYEGRATELQTIAIAWGGVLAQLVLFVVAYFLVNVGSPLPDAFMWVLLGCNLVGILFNLIPIAPLDGAVAWRIVPFAFRRLRFAATREQRIARDLTIRRPAPGPFRSSPAARDDLVIEDAESEALAERLRQARSAARGDATPTDS